MRTLECISARGSSKGLPREKILPLNGQPLIFVDPLGIVEMDAARAVDIDEATDLMFADLVAQRWGFAVIGH